MKIRRTVGEMIRKLDFTIVSQVKEELAMPENGKGRYDYGEVSDHFDTGTNRSIVRGQIVITILGWVLGAGCIVAGVFSIYSGLSGSAEAKLGDFFSYKGGIDGLLIAGGLYILYVTKFDIRKK